MKPGATLHRAVRWAARVLLVPVMLYVFFKATDNSPVSEGIMLNDKVLHMAAFYVLAMLTDLSLPYRRYRFVIPFFLFGYGLLLEIVQLYLPFRSFSSGDIAADLAGMIIYFSSVPLLRKLPWLTCLTADCQHRQPG